MKILKYYSLLLVFIVLFTGFLIQKEGTEMSMGQVLSLCVLLVFYIVAISFVGEGTTHDERDIAHRYMANRVALLAGTVVLSLGILYQLLTHVIDYWLLAGLIAINVVKIVSLIYSQYKK